MTIFDIEIMILTVILFLFFLDVARSMVVLDLDASYAVIFVCNSVDSPSEGQCGDIQANVLSRQRVFLNYIFT